MVKERLKMGTNTMIHDRKQKAQQAQARLKEKQPQPVEVDNELRDYLRAAAKAMGTLTLIDLSPAQQKALLEDYARRLEAEAADFLEAWPDAKHAHEWFVMARSGVLKQIAKLTINNVRSEFEQETEQ